MTYDRRTARTLCTAAELELVLASFEPGAGRLSEARLKSAMARARRLRDKYRDLLRRQRLATRARTGSKLGSRPGTNARTAQKARLFEETLARFAREREARAAAARRAVRAKRAGPRKAPAPKPPGLKPRAQRTAAAPRTGFVSEQALLASRRQRLQNMRAKAVQAHVRAQGRRNQARRDSRSR
jgi:hypothetical protein